MADYDFKPLNDKEFEALCIDIISMLESARFERFKPGRDAGVDGRYFKCGREVIVQCKHWPNSPLSKLVREFRTTEKAKLNKLLPHRYIVMVSNPLSRADKTKISAALEPHVLAPNDIFGSEDLNKALALNPEIERKHYKLWLCSTIVMQRLFANDVFGRSEFKVKECIESSRRYVVTENHTQALHQLETLKVAILTGEPGIGKTTLAEQLCLKYVTEGFELVEISKDISEAEGVLLPDTKQIFLFDDFLGQNYLDALSGHEGKSITRFIRRIASEQNKRFVLTSRSTILNQGKALIGSFQHANLARNEYELRIDKLTTLERATILYNHIFHSELSDDYKDGIYLNRRYRLIAKHKNFNPRLISYITGAARLNALTPLEYWDFISETLDNPTEVWEHPFTAQLDDFGRSCVFLAAFTRRLISERELRDSYQRYIAAPCNASMRGTRDFSTTIRILTGSFLKRYVFLSDGEERINITLFNPSIRDFVLRRVAGDSETIRLVAMSLLNLDALETVQSMANSNQVTQSLLSSIAESQLQHFANVGFQNASDGHVARLALVCAKEKAPNGTNLELIQIASRYLVSTDWRVQDHAIVEFLIWALRAQFVESDAVIEFSRRSVESVSDPEDYRPLNELLRETASSASEVKEQISKLISSELESILCDDLSNLVDVEDVYSELDYQQYKEAEDALVDKISDRLFEIGAGSMDIDESLIRQSVEEYGVQHSMDRFFERQDYGDYDDSKSMQSNDGISDVDAIDELFDRG